VTQQAFDIADLIFGKVVLVTGKGGVGKSSVTAALGRLAAAQGRRVCLIEADSQQSVLSGIFGTSVGYEPKQVAENLYACNVTWYEALHDWVERVVPSKRIVDMMLDNRLVRLFLDAVPGNREVVTLSKITWLSEEFDLVIVDLPASGHATALMQSPQRTMRLFNVGPLFTRSQESQALLEHPATHLVLVALPEEMVVNETVETWETLNKGVPGLSVPLVILNRASRPTLGADEIALLDRLSAARETETEAQGPQAELLLAGRWEARLEEATGRAIQRIEEQIGVKLIDVPRLSQAEGSDALVRTLASALARTSERGLKGRS
jgi:arsenite-transporting ATPase